MKLQLQSRRVQLAALVPLLAASITLAHAESDPQMDACIAAFVQSNFPNQRIRVDVRQYRDMRRLSRKDATSQIRLTARATHGRTQLASATCVVKNRDEVVALRPHAPNETADRPIRTAATR